jgi:hypothetical protein
MNHRSDFSNAPWHKSTRSGSAGCVEVATLKGVVGVRDSKDCQGPILVFRFDEWNAFLAGVRDGEFDIDSIILGRFLSDDQSPSPCRLQMPTTELTEPYL